MKLNHLNLTVSDVPAAKAFLIKYFGLRELDGFPIDDKFTGLLDDNGTILTLMRGHESAEIKYPSTFHIGFFQESEERVNEIHQRLIDDGFDVPAPKHFHGSWTFYLKAPGGFTVEVAR